MRLYSSEDPQGYGYFAQIALGLCRGEVMNSPSMHEKIISHVTKIRTLIIIIIIITIIIIIMIIIITKTLFRYRVF